MLEIFIAVIYFVLFMAFLCYLFDCTNTYNKCTEDPEGHCFIIIEENRGDVSYCCNCHKAWRKRVYRHIMGPSINQEEMSRDELYYLRETYPHLYTCKGTK